MSKRARRGRGHVGGDARTGFFYVANLGLQRARRCARTDDEGRPSPCRGGIVWHDQRGDTCPRCDGPLGDVVRVQRQEKRRGFAKAKDANDALVEVIGSVAGHAHVQREDVTLAEFFEEYVTTRQTLGKKIRASTAALYRASFARHVEARLGDRPVQEITTGDLDALYRELLATGRRHRRGGQPQGLSETSVRSVHTMLSGCFAYAVQKGRLRTNPARNADTPGTDTPETPSWSLEELRAFLARPAVQGHELLPLIQLAARTGLRRGELLALRWGDVDFDAATVRVRQALAEVDGVLTVGEPKTPRSTRTVKVGPSTLEVLRAHRATQDAHRDLMGAGWTDRGLVFPGVDGLPRRPTVVSSAFSALVAATGTTPAVTLHGLRHSHGSHLLEAGWPVHVVASRLGHDPAVLLRVYSHVTDTSQDRIDGHEALLDGAPPVLLVVDGDDTQPASEPTTQEVRSATQ